MGKKIDINKWVHIICNCESEYCFNYIVEGQEHLMMYKQNKRELFKHEHKQDVLNSKKNDK